MVRRAAVTALALGALLSPPARAEEIEVDAAALVRDYRSIVEDYRRYAPRSAVSRAIVEEAARWDVDLARLAATLSAMRPPAKSTVVRLDAVDDETGARRDEGGGAEVFGDERGRQYDIESRGGSRERLESSPRRSLGVWRPGSRDANDRLRADVPARPTGACLIETDAQGCADLLKAAALLHTAVGARTQDEGDAVRATRHRAIAAWLLWPLPGRAADDGFVRDWLVAAIDASRSGGALAWARRLGRLATERFPGDLYLLLWTARSEEALASLCYQEDGTPLVGDDCLDFPVELERPQPPPISLSAARPPDRKALLRETEADLEALLRVDTDDAEVRLRLGRALANRGREDEARRALTWVVDQAAESGLVALAHLLLGRLAGAQGDDVAALEHASAALAAAPRSQAARMAVVVARLEAGDRAGARALVAEPGDGSGRDLWPDFLVGRVVPSNAPLEALHARVRLP